MRSPAPPAHQPLLEEPEAPDLLPPSETSIPQDGASQEDLSTSVTPPRSQFAGRELRVKVWEQEDTLLIPPSDDETSSPPDVIEDLPTRPTLSAVPPALHDAAASPVPLPQNQTRDQLELLDTAQVATYGQAQPIPATPLPFADQETRIEKTPPIKEDFATPPATPAPSAPLAPQRLSMPAPTPFLGLGDVPFNPPMQDHRPAAPSHTPMQDHRSAVQPVAPSAPIAQSRKSRYPLLVFLILVPVFFVGALGIWIVQAQPFSVSPVTQPWQQFQDQKLGVSLLYPNGWLVQVDHAKSTIRFYDSSNTAQVVIAVTDAAGSDPTQHLSQQAKQLQMGSTKSVASITFARTSWTQIQGTTQQSGANYTTTLLAAVHNNRLFTVTQLAPSSNYTDQEKVNFSYMRDSWQFL